MGGGGGGEYHLMILRNCDENTLQEAKKFLGAVTLKNEEKHPKPQSKENAAQHRAQLSLTDT